VVRSSEGGYRKYYEGGKRGTTLQGGGSAGGLGIDYEFYESSLVPSIVVYGFMGLEADPCGTLAIRPRLPKSCPNMTLSNLLYRNVLMDVSVSDNLIKLSAKNKPAEAINIVFEGLYRQIDTQKVGSTFSLIKSGDHQFERQL